MLAGGIVFLQFSYLLLYRIKWVLFEEENFEFYAMKNLKEKQKGFWFVNLWQHIFSVISW